MNKPNSNTASHLPTDAAALFEDMDNDLNFNAPVKPVEKQVYRETCRKCAGSGNFVTYSGRVHGDCFACKGRGWNEYKLSPEKRAQGRKSAARGVSKRGEANRVKATEWLEANPERAEWFKQAMATGFEFAASLWNALHKYGSLTENQVRALDKCIASSAERKVKQAEQQAEAHKRGGDVDVGKIEEAFTVARENDVRWPKLRLDLFIFKPAPVHGRNGGAVYITRANDEAYLGMVKEGRFLPRPECSESESEAVLKAAGDPEAAAVAYGQRFGQCAVCGRELTNHVSIDRGIGPICAERFGW